MTDKNAAGGSSEREFRIYASTHGSKPVVVNIYGAGKLLDALARTRGDYPDSILYVREVIEAVVQVHLPDGTIQCFPPPTPINIRDGGPAK